MLIICYGLNRYVQTTSMESAVFIRDDLTVKGISICEEDDFELITISYVMR